MTPIILMICSIAVALFCGYMLNAFFPFPAKEVERDESLLGVQPPRPWPRNGSNPYPTKEKPVLPMPKCEPHDYNKCLMNSCARYLREHNEPFEK